MDPTQPQPADDRASPGTVPHPKPRRTRFLWLAGTASLVCLLGIAFLLAQHRILKRIEILRGAAHEPGADMVEVPAGEFLMGRADPSAPPQEKPQHKVSLRAFLIDKFEVSNARFKEFVDATKASPPRNLFEPYDLWQGDSMPAEIADLPVVNVDWEQAKAYCEWAGKRLPTEAEWEKAARGSDGRRFPWGEEAADPARANFGKAWSGRRSFARVDSRLVGASPCGALNLAGNVAEWVADWYDPNYYASSPSGDPTGPPSGEARSIRGGSFESQATEISTTYRDSLNPGDHFFKDVGFRCAKSIEGG